MVGKERDVTGTHSPTPTHEPAVPQDWPMGHVSVALTPDEIDECIEVVIHGAKHYLHSTTARELSNMLLARLDEWNVIAQDAGYSRV